jgi:parvulin-like peptidyl-prolyl isomerase
MPSILKEPLLHFFALGAAVFLVYAGLTRGSGDDRKIVVTRGQQRNLIATYEATWRRPPTREEFDFLVEDYLRQELAYRQSAAMELDRDDIVIRRRLRQKLELLTEDLAALTPPTETELVAYYGANPEKFRSAARFSFEHVYLSADRPDGEVASRAVELLARLRAEPGETPGAAELGDRIGLPAELGDVPEQEVAAIFGPEFAAALATVEPGVWAGPVRSGYGRHLVRVTMHEASRIPAYEDVAEEVRSEAMAARRRAAIDALYDRLAADYRIRIEPLAEPSDDARAAPVEDATIVRGAGL